MISRRPHYLELPPWPKARSQMNKHGMRKVVPRSRAVWQAALDGHVRACHKGEVDPKCAGCRDLTQKIEVSE